MSYQTNLKSSSFRDLNPQELDAVSGGNIVVTASRPSSGNIWSGSGDGAGGLSSGFNGFLFVDFSALASLATVDWDAFFEMMEAYRQSQEDLDGDGEPGITVTADRPFADTFAEMTFDQITIWNSIWLATGDEQAADVAAGTNISGDNPNDIRNADRKAELEAEMLGDAFEDLFNELNNQLQPNY